jgi:hypothetical protein
MNASAAPGRTDPGEWAGCAGHVPGDWAEWSDRACGNAALRMIMLAYLGDAPPLTELIMAGGATTLSATGMGMLASPPASGYRHRRRQSPRTNCPSGSRKPRSSSP